MNRIDRQFAKLKDAGQGAFCPYLCAGDPNLATTAKLIVELAARGADCIELGVPFSDPIADGPVLQAATQRALAGGVTLKKILAMVQTVRPQCDVPIALMTYYNPIHQYGVKELVDDAVKAGIDGFIVPDLPHEDAIDLIAAARAHDAKTIFFISPTTTPKRAKQIDRAATGFLYCLSVTGITGARKKLPAELRDHLQSLKDRTHHPLVVGFGVSTPQQVRQMCEVSDGVIVGSAMARLIESNLNSGQKTMIRRVGDYAARMARAAHRH